MLHSYKIQKILSYIYSLLCFQATFSFFIDFYYAVFFVKCHKKNWVYVLCYCKDVSKESSCQWMMNRGIFAASSICVKMLNENKKYLQLFSTMFLNTFSVIWFNLLYIWSIKTILSSMAQPLFSPVCLSLLWGDISKTM